MDDTDKVKYLLELAELHRKQFDSRRQVEWKMIFGFWTAMGLVFWYFDSRTQCLTRCEWGFLAFGLIACFACYVYEYLIPITGTNKKDLMLMVRYKQEAHKRITDDAHDLGIQEWPTKKEEKTDFRVCARKCAWKEVGRCYVICLCILHAIVCAITIKLLFGRIGC